MFEKEKRVGIIVYLYYNRDAKKVAPLGDVIYHSKKSRYLHLYVGEEKVHQLVQELPKEKFIKQVKTCHLNEFGTDFVGTLTQ